MRTTLVLASLLFASVAVAEEIAKHPFQSAVPRGRVQRVVIDIPAGEIQVVNGRNDRIALSGHSERDYDGASEGRWAQKVVKATTVEVYVNGEEAIVRRRFGADAQGWRAQKFTTVHLKLELPVGIDIDFETSAGEVKLNGSFGDVDVDLRAGEIEFRSPRSQIRELSASCRVGEVRAHLGDEIVSREGVLPGRTKYFNAAGKSHVNLHVTAGEVNVTLTQ
jgi:hypothetical protein